MFWRKFKVWPDDACYKNKIKDDSKSNHDITSKSVKHMVFIMRAISWFIECCNNYMQKTDDQAKRYPNIKLLMFYKGDCPSKRDK